MYALKRCALYCSKRRILAAYSQSNSAPSIRLRTLQAIRQSTAEARNLNAAIAIPPATSQQLQRHFWISAVPFIGFGASIVLFECVFQRLQSVSPHVIHHVILF